MIQHHTIGIDIGGTKIAVGVVDGHGQVRLRRATDPDDPDAIESAVTALVRELRTGFPVHAAGVAAAGLVRTDRSTVHFAPNIAWREHPLGERLATCLGMPVVVENDANAAGWAEFRYGAAHGLDPMLMLTIGTGLGGALIVNSNLVRGHGGIAAEFGHLTTVPGGHPCGCGNRGCWEQYASGRALTHRARLAASAQPHRAATLLELAGGEPAAIVGPHITIAATAGDPLALDLLTELGRWIGSGAANLVKTLDPAVIVIGGGVAAAGPLLINPVQAALNTALATSPAVTAPPVVVAQMPDDAGIVGAADLARTNPPGQH